MSFTYDVIKRGMERIVILLSLVGVLIFLQSGIIKIHYFKEDTITVFERKVLNGVMEVLPPSGTIGGFFDDKNAIPDEINRVYVLLQYVLSPRLLTYNILGYPFILAFVKNPSSLEFLLRGPFTLLRKIDETLFLLQMNEDKLKPYVDVQLPEHIFQISGEWGGLVKINDLTFRKVGSDFGFVVKAEDLHKVAVLEIFVPPLKREFPVYLKAFINERRAGEVKISREGHYSLTIALSPIESGNKIINLTFKVDKNVNIFVKGVVLK